ncbi:winged helix DNA-binding domain-containing protein [Conidiobolus coronatus NRRL 28638]|uniref:Winged helix DNA-binding domain-containing protein n=1 Tax=Conidiobolus coronatus (strain ATCC 28846 / CBS 209.66 / NRRL 28638) TaxID=796925 RepID=A0A137NQ49_CONC2|nr:winged helix DNA-binding domain-containing protein [Conidiobolus coronatus NRRL 28638]|eukprot:KXN64872.1 winged helix DNA-binding domain-containing protein [Conidiobolus coronatus NRRL 28638]
MSRSESFPMKLYNVITNSKYIEWSYEGDSFCIRDNVLFEQYVLPTSFNNKDVLSFSRQLLCYGFIRITDLRGGRDDSINNFSAFYHPKFKRDCPEDVQNIKKINKPKPLNPKIKHTKFVQIDPCKQKKPKMKDNKFEE